MHNYEAEKETVVTQTEIVLPGRKQRRIVIVENFHPDQEAMQEALEMLLRMGATRSGRTIQEQKN